MDLNFYKNPKRGYRESNILWKPMTWVWGAKCFLKDSDIGRSRKEYIERSSYGRTRKEKGDALAAFCHLF